MTWIPGELAKRIGGNSRSTVGTITDINPLLRLLYSRVGKPFIGWSDVFSFNNPQGMCPECKARRLRHHRPVDDANQ